MGLDLVCEGLLRSKEPSIRWKIRVHVLGENPDSPTLRELQNAIRRSPRVRTLLAHRLPGPPPKKAGDPYTKWHGTHWVLPALADLGYPPGDRSLLAMRDQLLDRWLNDVYYREFDAVTEAQAYRGKGVPRMRGRYRRCASQQGNALYALTTLGLGNERSDALAERLLHWQWPDGGWNCDKNPSADTSSFWESRHPMLGLAAYAKAKRDSAAKDAARRAADVFLSRELFRERRTGRVMNPEFVALHYPLYYEYDILGGLKAMAELGLIRDPRCRKALDLLEAKQLPSGGWAAEARFYRVSATPGSRTDSVDWGGTKLRAMNEWITVDALHVLRASCRF